MATKYVKAIDCADKISEVFGIPLHDLIDVFGEIPSADVAQVKHGEWELCDDAFCNDVEQHRCSVCKSEAIFECIYQPIYDENYDGEMEYIAEEFAGINEFLTDYCPHCGAKMDGGK